MASSWHVCLIPFLVWARALSFRTRSTVMLRAANQVVARVGKPAQVGGGLAWSAGGGEVPDRRKRAMDERLASWVPAANPEWAPSVSS